ncbi:MAG: site-2 protease family protein [Nitrososphaeria archaeon]|nr:site-2 protease family protein [Nitrososphaeria archaeon]
MPKKEFSFPFIIIKTEKGISILDSISKTWIARKSGWIFITLLPILAAITIYFTLTSIINIFSNPVVGQVIRELGPAINLPWPGINPYLPIVYGWIALFVGMIVHEVAHGVQARVAGVPVKFVGIILLIFLPIGAFVELDDKELEKAGLKKSAKSLAAGPGTNFITAIVSLALLLLIASSLQPIVDGVLITQMDKEGPAYKAGIIPGDIIISINGQPTNTLDNFVRAIEPYYKPGENLTLTIVRDREHRLNFTFTLGVNPENKSRGYMGIYNYLSFRDVLEGYNSIIYRFPSREVTLYMVIPTLPWTSASIPFSEMLYKYYYSTTFLGTNYHYIMNLLYWIWFLNFNLAIFNALPIYPLDGGIVFKFLCKRTLGSRIGNKGINIIVYTIALILAGLIALMIAAPYIS